jgi:hypothetical protein
MTGLSNYPKKLFWFLPLLLFFNEGFCEKTLLFNLDNDPHEENNVAQQNQEIFQNLHVLLEDWSRKVEFLRLMNDNHN